MGVKFNREYKEIVTDLANAIGHIEDCHSTFEMNREDWEALQMQDRQEYIRTLADDLFYALGSEPKMSVGSGSVHYDPSVHVIKIYSDSQVVHVVNLK